MEYNYERFKTSNYEYAKFPGPKAGDSLLDFPMTRLDGATVNLADYKGQWVVIETGSLTCPTTAPWVMIPVCLKGGWDALWDLVIALPGILWGHLKVDVARLFGKSPS